MNRPNFRRCHQGPAQVTGQASVQDPQMRCLVPSAAGASSSASVLSQRHRPN